MSKTQEKHPESRKKTGGLPAAAEPYKFKPGQTGNPGGRPSIPVLFKKHGDDAVKVIVDLMLKGKSEKTRFAAAQYVVDRIAGKPIQGVQFTLDQIAAEFGKMVREVMPDQADEIADRLEEAIAIKY